MVLVSAKVPPKVRLPEPVTVPDKVSPLTVPVPPTEVTVPVLDVLLLNVPQSAADRYPSVASDDCDIPTVTFPEVPPPVKGAEAVTPVMSPGLILAVIVRVSVAAFVLSVMLLPAANVNVSLFVSATIVV